MFVLDELLDFFMIYHFKGDLVKASQDASCKLILSKDAPFVYCNSIQGCWLGSLLLRREIGMLERLERKMRDCGLRLVSVIENSGII